MGTLLPFAFLLGWFSRRNLPEVNRTPSAKTRKRFTETSISGKYPLRLYSLWFTGCSCLFNATRKLSELLSFDLCEKVSVNSSYGARELHVSMLHYPIASVFHCDGYMVADPMSNAGEYSVN